MNDENSQTPPTTDEQAARPEGDAAELASLRAQVESQSRRLDEVMRAYAEILNERESFRTRLERERDRQVEGARGDVATGLLDTLDELRLALQSSGHQDVEAVVQGVRMICDGVQRRLQGIGLTPVEAMGRPFDPNQHEAVDLVPVADRDSDGVVVEEVRGGWRAGDRVVRAARVRVGRHVPQAS